MPSNPDIIGATSYSGLTAMQVDNFKDVFEKFLKDIRPARILEIGTSSGGLTMALNDIMMSLEIPYDIRTYDVNDQLWFWRLENDGIDVRIENLFTPDYLNLDPEKIDDIRSFIQGPGTTVVMCDGGSKLNEFRLLSPLIKTGDFIMAHDYALNPQFFEENINGIIWNWLEIHGDQIADVCVDNNLQDYMKDEFQNIVWACKVKR